ncbi:MAG: rubredoxin [Ferruginibacter sp.]
MGRIKLFPVYDILCAKDFNPNERTGEIFSKGNPRILLPEQLHRSVIQFYNYRASVLKANTAAVNVKKEAVQKKEDQYLYQCSSCLTVYDETMGEPENNIAAGTLFEALPPEYCCPLCETGKNGFNKIERAALQHLQAV